MVKIRLARGGRKNRPVYTIVAADVRSPRDGKFLEKLGQYNPLAKDKMLNSVNQEGIKKWLSQGAQISTTVHSLLKREGYAL